MDIHDYDPINLDDHVDDVYVERTLSPGSSISVVKRKLGWNRGMDVRKDGGTERWKKGMRDGGMEKRKQGRK